MLLVRMSCSGGWLYERLQSATLPKAHVGCVVMISKVGVSRARVSSADEECSL